MWAHKIHYSWHCHQSHLSHGNASNWPRCPSESHQHRSIGTDLRTRYQQSHSQSTGHITGTKHIHQRPQPGLPGHMAPVSTAANSRATSPTGTFIFLDVPQPLNLPRHQQHNSTNMQRHETGLRFSPASKFGATACLFPVVAEVEPCPW